MNIKNITVALIIALIYEILLKLSHILIPSLFNLSAVSGIAAALSFLAGIIIIVFMVAFYRAERANRKVTLLLKILIGCIILHFILRLQVTRNLFDYQTIRLGAEIIGFIKAVLLFGVLLVYQSEIPSTEKLFRQAAVIITVMFGIGILKSLYSLSCYARFVIAGIETQFAPMFYITVTILFFITHAAIIYFLYRYYQSSA